MTNKTKTRVRVNIRTLVNAEDIKRVRRFGRDKIIVPSATMPDDVIMNGIKYPAAEIAKSFSTLENSQAPLGHPTVEGNFVSANDPEGLNRGWIGAHNENVRRQGGRVFLDKVIDVERARESEGGRMVIEAIEKGEPIHTSTGLFCNLLPAEDDSHENVATDIYFDHDAILIGEKGAATPEQGVGIFVNSKGEKNEVDVINSSLEDDIDAQIEWAAEALASAADRKSRLPDISEIKAKLMRAIDFKGRTNHKETTQHQETEKMADDKQLEGIQNSMADLSKAVTDMPAAIAKTVGEALTEAIKPVVEFQANQIKKQEADEQAELDGYVDTIVKANKLEESVAKQLPLAAAKAMAKDCKPAKAAALNAAFPGGTEAARTNEFEGYDMNAAIDKEKEE